MYPQKGQVDSERLAKALEAKEFFLKFQNADCPRIAIENPMPLKIVGLPLESQRIQPYQFGEPFSKLTYLWLTNLPSLMPTKVCDSYKPYLPSNTSRNAGNSYNKGMAHGSKMRSKSFPGIAKAMAAEWGDELLKEETT